MASKPKDAKSAVVQHVLYVTLGRAEKVVASFADDLADLDLHIQAAKQRILNEARLGGADVNSAVFRVAPSTEG